MEQLYMVEIFIDKVAIFLDDGDNSAAAKKLIIKVNFGPKTQFIIKEGQLAPNDDNKNEELIECDENNRRKFSRTIRVGKSVLFPSYPDTVMQTLNKFPLQIEIWNDDQNEVEIFVGVGIMLWDTAFYHMLKSTAEACKLVEPLSIKQLTPIMAECCCKQCGEVSFILRLSALGDSIITEFQQLMKDPDTFVFRTNRAPSMFQCKRIEGDDPNFCMVGSLYETTTLEDPNVQNDATQKIEICTELQSCGVAGGDKDKYKCDHKTSSSSIEKKEYPIDKIRMGDIRGPCGNTNCPLAHKVKMYIRNLDTYKKEAAGKVTGNKDENRTGKVCGKCTCKDDRWHRDDCLKHQEPKPKDLCEGCGGRVEEGHTCEQMQNRTGSKGPTPKASETTVAYVFNVTKVPDFKDSMGLKCTKNKSLVKPTYGGCCCGKPKVVQRFENTNNYMTNNVCEQLPDNRLSQNVPSNNPFTYNMPANIDITETFHGTSSPAIFQNRRCKCNSTKALSEGCGCRQQQYISTDSDRTVSLEPSLNAASSSQNMANNNPLIYNVSIPVSIQRPQSTVVYNSTVSSEKKNCRCSSQPPAVGGCCCSKLNRPQSIKSIDVNASDFLPLTSDVESSRGHMAINNALIYDMPNVYMSTATTGNNSSAMSTNRKPSTAGCCCGKPKPVQNIRNHEVNIKPEITLSKRTISNTKQLMYDLASPANISMSKTTALYNNNRTVCRNYKSGPPTPLSGGCRCIKLRNTDNNPNVTPSRNPMSNKQFLYDIPSPANATTGNCNATFDNRNYKSGPPTPLSEGCRCGQLRMEQNLKVKDISINPVVMPSRQNTTNNNQLVYNMTQPANVSMSKTKTTTAVYNCVAPYDIKDCKCEPPKPKPPCNTFDCECIPESINITARKHHSPYCPSYRHKDNCPVTLLNEEQEEKKKDEDEDEPEPLPYGLPPIVLGPCPVMGRPCTVPDGFARMYKSGAMAPQPPSFSDAGKVCCSKEYERIKKAIKEYMKYEKDHDLRCINRFDVDTERRCCDKEQMLIAMTGKGCCGAHKLSLQEKFKEEKK